MTQKIFDIENEKDMKDLWDILPDEIYEVRKGYGDSELDNTYFFKDGYVSTLLISINWHDETKITRSVDYEKMIGCVGWFWDNNNDKKLLDVLMDYKPNGFRFTTSAGKTYANFTPARNSELKFYGDDE